MLNVTAAAQSVLDAWGSEWCKGSFCHEERSIAAALRAAGDTLSHPISAHTLYAIADELEAQ